MPILDFVSSLDWWQLCWLLDGLFMVLFFGYAFATRKTSVKMQEAGYDKGYHDRQHWETDAIVKGKLEKQ
jgi:hypothetical protein